MSVAAADMLWKFSVSAAAGDTTPGLAITSLGDQMSTTEVPDNTLDGLFDSVSAAENLGSDVEYRCIFLHNNHATLAALDVILWIQSEVASGATMALSVDTTGVVLKTDTLQAKAIVDENTAPTAQSFTSPINQASGLSLGDIPAGSCIAIWVRRTAHNTVAVPADGGTLRIFVETA